MVYGTIAAIAMAPEIVTKAIIAAVLAGATDTTESAIADAYQSVKSLAKKKFGHDSDVAETIDMLEAKPASHARKILVAEELKAVNSAAEAELVSAAQSLLALIEALPQGEQHIRVSQGRHRPSRPWQHRHRDVAWAAKKR
jgi:hypothetical protein